MSKSLLLDLLSSTQSVTQQRLDEADWPILMDMAHQHRLEPLLYWRLKERQLFSPDPINGQLAKCHQRATLRALALQAELLALHRLLAQANIPHLALKGSYLACHAYPQAGLRPMRDIDMLVPKSNLEEAYHLLLAKGYTHPSKYKGRPEAYIQKGKHLPPLRTPSGKVLVELHDKVFHPEDWPGQDLTKEPGFWERATTVTTAGVPLPVMGATDLLLHLIVHGSYDHKFNNGPLLFSDIAYLLHTQRIDWSLFWKMAKAGKGERGCQLVLEMVRHYHGTLGMDWTKILGEDTAALKSQAQRFALLTLQNYELRNDQAVVGMLIERKSLKSKGGLVLRKFFPPKHQLSSRYPLQANSPLIYLCYPLKWLQLISRLPSVLRVKNNKELNAESKELAALNTFLKENTSPKP